MPAPTERAARIIGWSMLVLSALLVLRPTGPLTSASLRRWKQYQREQTISAHWAEFVGNSPTIGNAAEPTVVEFIAYDCEYCRRFDVTMREYIKTHAQSSFVIRQLPNRFVPRSRGASVAALCAHEQDQFVQMHTFLLTDTLWAKTDDWTETARRAGIRSSDKFARCQASTATAARITQDSALAAQIGLRVTPMLLSRDRGMKVGELTLGELVDWKDGRGH